mmetsp:Transcript_104520/g.239502  ORF Transcript_104520/g.239502 Transcript_104520/m.239502 type:complete len:330 (-) Transcript_104520:877-1866(-)
MKLTVTSSACKGSVFSSSQLIGEWCGRLAMALLGSSCPTSSKYRALSLRVKFRPGAKDAGAVWRTGACSGYSISVRTACFESVMMSSAACCTCSVCTVVSFMNTFLTTGAGVGGADCLLANCINCCLISMFCLAMASSCSCIFRLSGEGGGGPAQVTTCGGARDWDGVTGSAAAAGRGVETSAGGAGFGGSGVGCGCAGGSALAGSGGGAGFGASGCGAGSGGTGVGSTTTGAGVGSGAGVGAGSGAAGLGGVSSLGSSSSTGGTRASGRTLLSQAIKSSPLRVNPNSAGGTSSSWVLPEGARSWYPVTDVPGPPSHDLRTLSSPVWKA